MLCLSLLPGEYLTIGDNIVLQYEHTMGERCKLAVNAPREVTILRGEVRERSGEERPACVSEKKRWCRRELPWNRSKAQTLSAMRRLLSRMDGKDEDVKTLRRQINHIFPPERETDLVSSG